MNLDDDSESIIIIDDFLSRPHELRQRALSSDYPAADHDAYFPGRNSAGQHPLPGLDQYVAKLTGQTLAPAPRTFHGAFRLCLAGETGSGGVHTDPCHWSGIIYLSLPEDCEGGTDFFRHRRTKTIRAPVFPGEFEQLPITREELGQDLISPHSTDPVRWELVRHVPMRFNRMIVFRPWLWHNARPGFGDSVENGRLIYVMFYICTDPGWG